MGGGGIHFSADCLGGIMKICMDLGGDIKKQAAEKKSSAPPRSIHNECSLRTFSLKFTPEPARRRTTFFSLTLTSLNRENLNVHNVLHGIRERVKFCSFNTLLLM